MTFTPHTSIDGPSAVSPVWSIYSITGTGVANSTVTLHFHTAGMRAGEYSLARNVSVGADGTWSRPLGERRLPVLRDQLGEASPVSSSVLLQPAVLVNGKSTRTIKRGTRYTVTGRTVPGTTVFLHLHRTGMKAGDYSALQSTRSASDGSWSVTLTANSDVRFFASRARGDRVSATTYLVLAR